MAASPADSQIFNIVGHTCGCAVLDLSDLALIHRWIWPATKTYLPCPVVPPLLPSKSWRFGCAGEASRGKMSGCRARVFPLKEFLKIRDAILCLNVTRMLADCSRYWHNWIRICLHLQFRYLQLALAQHCSTSFFPEDLGNAMEGFRSGGS